MLFNIYAESLLDSFDQDIRIFLFKFPVSFSAFPVFIRLPEIFIIDAGRTMYDLSSEYHHLNNGLEFSKYYVWVYLPQEY